VRLVPGRGVVDAKCVGVIDGDDDGLAVLLDVGDAVGRAAFDGVAVGRGVVDGLGVEVVTTPTMACTGSFACSGVGRTCT
jgi:hypothetical protein